ncbi:MAG: flagellar export chaperone FlgN [Clostridium sp.]|jgi:flagellar biosynthesis/type III secretory pathway chaperone|uniref:flagellar export chaperone FlgN n=1 Tax=Clostridium TaxID=1485 RepID=UPI001C1E4F39|nr:MULTISPECIES: flagellar export chaperone FlgN [Clostridium]MBS6501997.1 flagellar protein FlgN [Clostridium sp.]MBU6135935.1 flagellar protein FlgN [Clostridium tertium]MDU3548226.1 flagellar export chaperone FlgN [Clostridium sp.]MDU6364904.1 flagellar export chaperone FlgN [Clostridium sp.]
MINNLRDILYDEEKELKELLILLDKQYKLIIAKDIFGMESIVEDIKQKNKDVAEIEVSRRRLLGNQSIKEVILNSKDEELENGYRRIQNLLNEMILQKDTNDLLIKQQLSFTNKLLNLINPKRDIQTYNSYGSIKR